MPKGSEELIVFDDKYEVTIYGVNLNQPMVAILAGTTPQNKYDLLQTQIEGAATRIWLPVRQSQFSVTFRPQRSGGVYRNPNTDRYLLLAAPQTPPREVIYDPFPTTQTTQTTQSTESLIE